MNRTFKTKSKHGYSVKFSPYFPERLACVSSQYYGIAGSGSLVILELVPDGVRIKQSFDWKDGLFDLTWAEDNENIVVTAGGDGSIQIWDILQTQGPLQVYKEHEKEVNSVDWSQTREENFILSASWDHSVKLWEVNRNTSLATFLGHKYIVYQAAWSPHIPGCFATASGDHTLCLWDTRNPSQCSTSIPAHQSEILSCDWCKYDPNILFSGGVDGLLKGWDIRNPHAPVCEMGGHRYSVRRVKASPFHGPIVATASYDFSVKIWNFLDQTCIDTIEHHSEFVYGLDMSCHEPGLMADCGWDELIHVYHRPSTLLVQQ